MYKVSCTCRTDFASVTFIKQINMCQLTVSHSYLREERDVWNLLQIYILLNGWPDKIPTHGQLAKHYYNAGVPIYETMMGIATTS